MRVNAFWQRVRSLIRERHVTQAILAEACGIPPSTFSRWITKNIIPTLDVASAISRYFGTSLDYLTFGKDTEMIAEIGEILDSLKKINDKHKTVLQNKFTRN